MTSSEDHLKEWANILAELWYDVRLDVFAHRLQAEQLVATCSPLLRTLTALLSDRRDVLDNEWRELLIYWIRNGCSDETELVRVRAHEWLCRGLTQDAIDAVCQMAWTLDDTKACTVAMECHYLPSDPAERALFLYHTEQWGVLAEHDPSGEQLTKGYHHKAPDDVRLRLRKIAVRESRLDLVSAMTQKDDLEVVSKLTSDEFNVALSILVANSQWDRIKMFGRVCPNRFTAENWRVVIDAGMSVPEVLWNLVLIAPIVAGLHCLEALRDSDWQPERSEPLDSRKGILSMLPGNLPEYPGLYQIRELDRNPGMPTSCELVSTQNTQQYEFTFQGLGYQGRTASHWKYTYCAQAVPQEQFFVCRRDDGDWATYGTSFPDSLLLKTPQLITNFELCEMARLRPFYRNLEDARLVGCILAFVTWAQQQVRLSVGRKETGRFVMLSAEQNEDVQSRSPVVATQR